MPRILVYHNFCGPDQTRDDGINIDAVRSQVEFLKRHYNVVNLPELCEIIPSRRLPRNVVALTVDDGRRNFYEFLFPLLKKYEIPATFFVVSSFINREDWIWTDKILWLSRQSHRPRELSPARIAGFFHRLNRMSPAVRNESITAVAAKMGIRIPTQAPTEYSPCSWAELGEMCDSGLVQVGSHTVTHPILSSLSEEESWREIHASRVEIERRLGRPVTSFAIPNGTKDDYDAIHLKQITDAGYANTVVASCGLVQDRDVLFELPRLGIAEWTVGCRFAARVDGVEHYRGRVRTACSTIRKRLELRVHDPSSSAERHSPVSSLMTGSSD